MLTDFFGKNKSTSEVGMSGEKLAAEYLKKQGYRILDRNFKNKIGRQMGEIDIIVEKGKEIFFVEVKTRVSDNPNVLPEQNINRGKLRKLAKIGQYYIQKQKLWDFSYHFDCISVSKSNLSDKIEIKHIKDIFF